MKKKTKCFQNTVWNMKRKMLVPVHLMPPSTFKYNSARPPALVAAAGLRGARNICSDEWPNARTDYCGQIGAIILDSEQDFMTPVVAPAQTTQPARSAVECADATEVRDASFLLLACWFSIFVQLLVLSERERD